MKNEKINKLKTPLIENNLKDHKTSSCKDLFFDFIKKLSKIDLRNYKPKARIIGSIIACIILVAFSISIITGAVLGIKGVASTFFWNILPSELPLVGPEKSDYFSDFTDGKWVEHLGKFYRSFSDLNHIFLFPETPGALLKFHKPLPERKEVEFKFSPLSEDSANIVINVGNLYEIVIGDNNYKTVSVKARIDPDEKWEFIPEKQSGQLTKDMIGGGMRRSSEVIMKIDTEHRLDGNYFLDLKIRYIPIEPINAGYQNFHGQYIFTPHFQEYKPLDISVGLINPKLKTDVAVRFTSFKIEE